MEQILEKPEVKSSNAGRILAALGTLAVFSGAGVVWYFNPSNVNFLPVCPLYSMTGIACPGCGLTRGFHALFHGDILTALDYNAMIPIFSLILGYFFLSMVLVAVRGRGLSINYLKPPLVWTFLFLTLGFAVLRNLPYYPFSILYP
ncbi:MAG: DUF2752 domain-containing protein [Pyrinomonadaceae bacterium]|nr:DUF2752 domain-containing protein [Pyrinomonadaceae bacterium]